MRGLDDGPDGLNDQAWERALNGVRKVRAVSPKYRHYKGVLIEQVGLSYYTWLDFVTPAHLQPHHTTLAAAKATIAAARPALVCANCWAPKPRIAKTCVSVGCVSNVWVPALEVCS